MLARGISGTAGSRPHQAPDSCTNILATVTPKLIAGLVVVVLLLCLFIWVKWDDAEQPKQEARCAKAAETAKQTAQTAIDRVESVASFDQLVAETARQIDNPPLP